MNGGSGGSGSRSQARDTKNAGVQVTTTAGSTILKPAKFAVYQNPALAAAITATSLRPSTSTFFFFFFLSSASATLLLAFNSRETVIIAKLKQCNISKGVSYVLAKLLQAVVGFIFLGAASALIKVIVALRRTSIRSSATVVALPNAPKDKAFLTNRQLGLLGLQPKREILAPESSKKPPKSKSLPTAFSDPLVPLHQNMGGSIRPNRIGSERSSASGAKRTQSFGTPSKSPGSPSSPYLVPSASSQLQSGQSSPGLEQLPWLNKRASPAKEIVTEQELEHFLADVDLKITQSAEKLATPPPTRNGFGVASPGTLPSSTNTSGNTRTTPLRPVRLSPASQKFSTPPKKGEGELPSPMSMEESIEAFDRLGIYPLIESWRDHLRQWFSSFLLGPLLGKIETSHAQVMQAAARLGISIKISQVGSDLSTAGTPASVSPMERSKEWQPASTPDEDVLLQQLRASLVQALDASAQRSVFTNQQQSGQQNESLSIIRECVDAITEHQRLQTLMKGELIKGLLPQSSITAEYTVQRIRELAEGTCCKNYEYMRSGEVYDKVKKKKWTLELPTDAHLLLYLFCAFLEYPKWMLHVDPSSYSGVQSSKNPLLLGFLPSKERFPEKYVAVISFVPSNLHPGACVLAIGRQSPPIFALYWDKKPQFSLQGRTALWDSILLLCHRIKMGFGGFVRGLHLGSSALSILPLLESEDEE